MFSNIGENIKYFRKEKGMKMNEMAEKLGITAVTLSGIESGKGAVRLDILEKIAELLDIKVERLLFNRDSLVVDSEILNKLQEETKK